MTKQDLLTYAAIMAGIVAIFQLFEYLIEKNIPWLFRLTRRSFRWLKRRLHLTRIPEGQRFILVNFSSHLIQPGQRRDMQKTLQWPAIEEVDARLGTVPEKQNFTRYLINHVEGIDLTANEWQTARLAVVPAGYAPAWSIILAELHGRLGYFPDIVRLRPAPEPAEEKFEVAEVVTLREIRSKARSKR